MEDKKLINLFKQQKMNLGNTIQLGHGSNQAKNIKICSMKINEIEKAKFYYYLGFLLLKLNKSE